MSPFLRLTKHELEAGSSSESGEAQPARRGSDGSGLGSEARAPLDSRPVREGYLSAEREAMKQELSRVKATLSAIAASSPPPPATRAMPGPQVPSGAPQAPVALQEASINNISGSAAAAASQMPATPVPGAHASALEKLLEEVRSRLGGIEARYGQMSQKLSKVDNRTAENERTVRELQHISAGAVHETARLVDIWGGSSAVAGHTLSTSGDATVVGTALPPAPRSAQTTPPPKRVSSSRHTVGLHHPALLAAQATSSPYAFAAASSSLVGRSVPAGASTLGSPGLGGVNQTTVGLGLSPAATTTLALAEPHHLQPHHLGVSLAGSQAVSALHQHASQIHKLIAGLDFLEQHIIHQDQVIEGVQKQILALSHEQQQLQVGTLGLPATGLQLSEVSVRLHDASELLGKLRAHVYKLDKKAAASEAAHQVLHAQLEHVSLRMELLQHTRVAQHSVAGGAVGPEGALQVRQQGKELAQLRDDCSSVSDMLHELMQQVQQLALNQLAFQQQQQRKCSPGLPTELIAQAVRAELAQHPLLAAAPDMLQRLASLDIAQHSVRCTVQQQQDDVQALRQQLADVVQGLEEQVAAAAAKTAQALAPCAAVASRSASLSASSDGMLDVPAALLLLQSHVDTLAEHLHLGMDKLATKCAATESTVAALAGDVAAARVVADEARHGAASDLALLEQRLAAQLSALAAGVDTAEASQGALMAQLRDEVQERLDGHVQQVAAGLAELQSKAQDLGAQVAAQGHEHEQELAMLQAAILSSRQSVQAVSDQVVDLAGQLDQQSSQRLPDLERRLAQSVEQAVLSVQVLHSDLAGVRTTAMDAVTRLGDLATRVQMGGLAAAVEELQGSCAEALAGLGHLKALVQRDYISREALGAIFAAREDIKSAVSKMEQVLSAGHIQSGAEEPKDSWLLQVETAAGTGQVHTTAALSAQPVSGPTSTQLHAMQQRLTHLASHVSLLEARLIAQAHPPPAAGGEVRSVEEAAARIRQLEAQVQKLREFACKAEPVVTDGVEGLRRSVQDLQLMLFDLRGSSWPASGHSVTLSGRVGALERRSSPGHVLSPAMGHMGPSRFACSASASGAVGLGGVVIGGEGGAEAGGPGGPTGASDRVDPLQGLCDYHGFAAPSGNPWPPPEPQPVFLPGQGHDATQQLEKRLTQVEMSLSGKLVALEAALARSGSLGIGGIGLHVDEEEEEQPALGESWMQLQGEGATQAQAGNKSTAEAQQRPRPHNHSELEGLQAQLSALATQVAALATAMPSPALKDAPANATPAAHAPHSTVPSSATSGTGSDAGTHGLATASPHAMVVVMPASGPLPSVLQQPPTLLLPVRLRTGAEEEDVCLTLSIRVPAGEQAQLTDPHAAGPQQATPVPVPAGAVPDAVLVVGSAQFGSELSALSARLRQVEATSVSHSCQLLHLADWGALMSTLRVQVHNLVEDAKSLDADRAVGRRACEELALRLAAVEERTQASTGAAQHATGACAAMMQVVQDLQQQLLHGGAPIADEVQAPAAPVVLEHQQQMLTRLAAVEASCRWLSDNYGALSRAVQVLAHSHTSLEPGTPDTVEGAPTTIHLLESATSPGLSLPSAAQPTLVALPTTITSTALLGRVQGDTSLASTSASGMLNAVHALGLASSEAARASANASNLSPAHVVVAQQEQQALPLQQGEQHGALREVAAKVAALEELVSTCLGQQQQPPPVDPASGGAQAQSASGPALSGHAAGGADVLALEGKLSEYGKVLQAMRNRILALQEYVDSTQGMVKELHTVHGTVLLRLSALEEQGGASSSADTASGSAAGPLGEVQADLGALEARFAAFATSQVQLSGALDGLKRVGERLVELDTRDGEMAAKLAAIGQTMPTIAAQLKSLERSLQARLDACCSQLAALSSVLADMSRMERPDSKNPFAGIAGGNNAPAVKLLESKVELLRGSLANVARALQDEFRRSDPL